VEDIHIIFVLVFIKLQLINLHEEYTVLMQQQPAVGNEEGVLKLALRSPVITSRCLFDKWLMD